jgi:ABC-type uncharacterized transport system involved in gliding motility auxiliary subunit
MLRKIIDNVGFAGLVILIVGFWLYSLSNLWDWKSLGAIGVGAVLLLAHLFFNLNKVKTTLASRSARFGGMAFATLLLGLGILVLLNFLNYRHHTRFDLSEGRVNALSSQTVKVLENLDQEIQITGFFEDEQGGTRFRNLVREFHYVTPKVDFEVVDPLKDPGKVAQFEITRNGQVVVAGSTKQEMLEDITEEKLTNAIIKITRDVEKVVYFLTGHGEHDLSQSEPEGYSTVESEIKKQNYRVEIYNLAQENKIPEDASVIVSAGPKVDFFPNELELLKEYLVSGGKFLLLMDPESEADMHGFLELYGVRLNDDFVVDATGLGQLFGFGAAAPLGVDYASHPITEDLQETMSIFPGARSVASVASELEFVTTELVRSSPQSWGESEIEAEEVSFDEELDTAGPVALAVVSVKSVTQEDSTEDSEEGDEGGESSPEGVETRADESPGKEDGEVSQTEENRPLESRIVVFGDSEFASNAYFGTAVNGDLFLNAVSWLAEDTDLLSIRPKDPENRTITLTETDSRMVFWATVVLFPLTTLVLGFAVWSRRRSEKR